VRCELFFGPALSFNDLRELKMSKREQQISVPLDPDLRAFVEQLAAREDRTVAGQIRHLIAQSKRAEAQAIEAAA
jgi:hypothetical protein